MKRKQMFVNNSFEKATSDLLNELAEVCYFDLSKGEFCCRKCHNIVYIDLSRHYAFCPVDGMLV
jgi:hypothetical protein